MEKTWSNGRDCLSPSPTPTIAKNSYIDPRVIDLYEDGKTIDPQILTRYRSPDRRQEAVERAVLDLLS